MRQTYQLVHHVHAQEMYAIAESWICGNPYKLYLSKAGVRLVAAIAVWEPKPPLWLQIWPAAITATRCDSVGQSPDGQKFLCPALHYFDISEILSHESLGDKICHCTNRSLKMAWGWKKKKMKDMPGDGGGMWEGCLEAFSPRRWLLIQLFTQVPSVNQVKSCRRTLAEEMQ